MKGQLGKISIQTEPFIIIILMMILCFQRQIISIFSYADRFDEILFLVMLTYLCINSLTMSRYRLFDIICFGSGIFLILIGLLGNINSRVLIDPFQISVDIISTFKVLIAFYFILSINLTKINCDYIIRKTASIIRLVFFIMAIFAILTYFRVISGMTGDIRYGIASFKFIFNAAGNMSKFFYFAIPVLCADLYYQNNRINMLYVFLGLLLWVLTLRSRAIAFVSCFIVFFFWFFYYKKNKKKKLNILILLSIAVIAINIGWERIVYYLTNEKQARANLLKYSLVNAKKYFPIGSGFGTYGSDVAAKIYSPLYENYGFLSIYGIGKGHTRFLNDNYWPMIIGQFGIIGLFLMILIIGIIYKKCIVTTRSNKYFHFATICMIFFLFASSIASKSYSEFVSIPVFMLHAVLVKREMGCRSNRINMGCVHDGTY